MCCKLKLCLRMLSLRKQMHGVSFHTVEWLYLAWSLAPHCGVVVLSMESCSTLWSVCLIHRLHSIPTTLQVSFFGTNQGNSLSHLVLYCTKCFELSSLPTFLFLALIFFFHNFSLLLLLVSIPVFQSLHSLHLPGISILFFQNLNSFLLPVISIFLFLNLNCLLPCLLILFQNPEYLFPLCSLLHCSPHPLCHLLP